MNLASILEILKQLVGGFGTINDLSKWSVLSVQYAGKQVGGTVKSVHADPMTLELKVEFQPEGAEAITVQLKAVHHSPQRAKVLVDGTLDEDAALIFSWKGSPANPSRWGFDFKRVTLDGEDYRFNIRFDP